MKVSDAILSDDIETENYFVRHYISDPRRVIVSFASLGFATLGGPVEEFRRSLDQAGPSYIFVTDRGANWYNNLETDHIFQLVANMCSKYEYVASLGESAGGCGAIIFTNFYTSINRVLAFCPQFSVASPFREFDNTRDYGTKQAISIYRNIDFSTCTNKDRIQLIYGNADWRDYIHSSMYAGLGFRTLYIEGADHEVASSLKRSQYGDLLTPLIVDFSDFTTNFSENDIIKSLSPMRALRNLRPKNCEMAAASLPRFQPLRHIQQALDLQLVSENKPALQSSTCEFSRSSDPAIDASGANDGVITKSFGFHTNFEYNAWWQVDLLECYNIREIRVYNRCESVELAIRSSEFRILVKDSEDKDWVQVLTREGLTPIGLDGEPYIWHPYRPVSARFVRIQLLHQNPMHFRQVQIFA